MSAIRESDFVARSEGNLHNMYGIKQCSVCGIGIRLCVTELECDIVWRVFFVV